MQVKIPKDTVNMDESPTSSHQKSDKTCTSSVYISQPSSAGSVNNDHVINGSSKNHTTLNGNVVDVNSNCEQQQQKPVLTIQVNQNNPTVMNQSSSNLVNIVSCFRAYPTSTISHSNAESNVGNENLVQNSNNNNHNNNNTAPFSVSVNRNNCDYVGKSSGDESVNNENNQNIINIEASLKNNNNFTENQNEAQPKSTVKREVVDLNEICVDNSSLASENQNQNQNHDSNASSCILNSSSNMDYKNSSLETITNQTYIGLHTNNKNNGNENEKMNIGTTNSDTGTNVGNENVANISLNIQPQQQSSNNVINHITIETSDDVENKGNRLRNDNSSKSESQSHRDQRRRERRERRQARQRAQLQHGHHHITAPVHQRANINASSNGIRTLNGVEPSRASNFEILPDIINHQPPAYTTLPLQLPPSPTTLHTISPVPVVVDDCRFSFPIPIIRR
jgi:hypothetical protein